MNRRTNERLEILWSIVVILGTISGSAILIFSLANIYNDAESLRTQLLADGLIGGGMIEL